MAHRENHRTTRIGWLRAAVLGANDGIISTASLIIGVSAFNGSRESVLTAGVAGLVAGAMSMAAGEYVSVSSQSDTEKADLKRERKELANDSEHELLELTEIYIDRGLDEVLARQVAQQLTAHDALAAHARDELGILEMTRANPIQAAFTSAATFSLGAALPLLASYMASEQRISTVVAITSVGFLAALGWLSASTGGSPVTKSILRIVLWGTLAMAATAGIGRIFGTTA